MDEEVRKAAAGAVVEKAKDLLGQRADLLQQRADLDRKIRGVDRALFDCRAAGRLFGVDVELPEDVRPGVIIRPAQRPPEPPRRFGALAQASLELAPSTTPKAGAFAYSVTGPVARSVPTVASTTLPADAEPSIRDLILLYLKQAGATGEKAAVLRRRVETFLNRQIHYKTIGMSLYRLSKEKPPMVRREGQVWFLAFPWVETKDPGAATPGSVERG